MSFLEETKAAGEELKKESPVKACADCKHCQDHPTLQLKSHSICTRPGLPQRIDMITGEAMLDHCSTQRIEGSGRCSIAADFFEPIEDHFDELTIFREKSIDWWNTRAAFSRYMYQEHKDRGYDAAAANKSQKEYSAARSHYEKKYSEEFQFEIRPVDVSQKAPSGVDMSISE